MSWKRRRRSRQFTFNEHVPTQLRALAGIEPLPSKNMDFDCDLMIQHVLVGAYNAAEGHRDAVSIYTYSVASLARSLGLDPSALNEEWPDEP